MTITVDICAFRIGTNSVAIGLVNPVEQTSGPIDFYCCLQLIHSNEVPRFNAMQVQTVPNSDLAYKLIDKIVGGNWMVTVNRGEVATITLQFNKDRAEYINEYCFTSSSVTSDYDPSDWMVYGSNDNVQYSHIGNYTNAYFSDREIQRCFYLPSNSNPGPITSLSLRNLRMLTCRIIPLLFQKLYWIRSILRPWAFPI